MNQSAKPRFVLFTPEVGDAEAFKPRLTAACAAADIAAVVLRLAPAPDEEQIARLEMLAPAVHVIDASLLLDGMPRLVAQAGADGVFVNGDTVAAARSSVKNDHVVGAGMLESRHDAMSAGEEGADFVLFGDRLKDGQRPTMPSLVERVIWWAEVFVIPCVAYASQIDEIAPLARAGADFIALGEEIVWSASDPASALAAAGAQLLVAERV
jgi:thiamine-phosphate pyrophosphorylase